MAKKSAKRGSPIRDQFAVLRELVQVSTAMLGHGLSGMPLKLGKAILKDSRLDPLWQSERLLGMVGDVLLDLFDSLGPVYGKAGQVALSRLSEPMQAKAERMHLGRLYGDWPALSFSEIEAILDREIPNWHDHLDVHPQPLGVASMAQVHQAIDRDGHTWAIKIIKPKAKKRLFETLAAIEQILRVARPLARTASAKRLCREVDELVAALRQETDLERECQNIERMRHKLSSKKQTLLRIPAVHPDLCTKAVLTMEYFKGHSLAKLVANPEQLSPEHRKFLAKKVLSELLVQVFELGLFHADPHAGNLILLEDGSIGLCDWGLQGELAESDRRHIASILKAVIGMNIEQLSHALVEMAAENGTKIHPDDVRKELGKLGRLIKHHEEAGTRPSFHELMEASLRAAEHLAIQVPQGLLLMTKAMLTIEGLAKGIDPDVSFVRVATPVLFKASRPGLGDFIGLAMNAPKIARKLFA